MTTTMTTTTAMADVSGSMVQKAQTFDYKPFRHAARGLINEKITRERFVLDWRLAQEAQGIRATSRKVLKALDGV